MRQFRTATMLAALLLFTACSEAEERPEASGDRDESTEDGGSDADPQAIADAALLRLDDFPSGWESEPVDDVGDEEFRKRITDCIGIDIEDFYGSVADAQSPAFVSPDDEVISSSAAVLDDANEAEGRFEVLRTTEYRDCIAGEMSRIVQSETADDVFVGEARVNETSFETFGDDTESLRVSVQFEAEGFEFDAYLDVVYIQVDRVGATLEAFSVFSPFPADDLVGYAELITDRLRDMLADPSNSAGTDGDISGESSTTTRPPPVEPAGTLDSAFLQGTMDGDLPAGNSDEVEVIAVGPVLSSTPVVVRNNTTEPVTVHLSATARAVDGSLVGSGADQGLHPAVVEPGHLAIGYVYLGLDDPPEGSTVEVEARGDQVDREFGPVPGAIIEHNLTTGESGNQQVVGIVRNESGQEMTGPISVLLMCFDDAGNPVAAISGFADLDSLDTGQEGSFSVDIFEANCGRYLVGASGWSF